MKYYEIGQHIFIGCNSFISKEKTPYTNKKSNKCRFLNLIGQEAIVLSEPWVENIRTIGCEHSYDHERIYIQLVSNGKRYSITNEYHCNTLAEVKTQTACMQALAEDLEKWSDELLDDLVDY